MNVGMSQIKKSLIKILGKRRPHKYHILKCDIVLESVGSDRYYNPKNNEPRIISECIPFTNRITHQMEHKCINPSQ